MALAAHPAFAAHAGAAPAFRVHRTAVTAPAETVAAVTAVPKAAAYVFDPLGASHIALSSFV
ncbi:hypothetical protein D3C86_1915010 [compost metagenome]